jgi:hypothetical protein
MKAELLAIRAINQYRRRDILAYLGLRYYLDSDCSKKDIWIRDISTHLVNTRESPIYFQSSHFKEIQNDQVCHRNIYLPGPNEMLAESALLHSCSMESSFQSMECVYSYHFPETCSNEGIFKNYFPGFQERNASIAEVCKNLNHTDTIVRYTDIKKFYPSISHDLALKAWKLACDSSKLSHSDRELGEKILAQYVEVSQSRKEGFGVLTGPMFSHLIANLVLFEIDKSMFEYSEKKYWRYVDDFVFVGNINEITQNRKLLESKLNELGFSLHDQGKDFEVTSDLWLEGFNSFNKPKSESWFNFIKWIKHFLITQPEQQSNLKNSLLDKGIRIPLMDYSSVVKEPSYRQRLFNWLKKYSWASNFLNSLTIDKLVDQALNVRNFYQQEINTILEGDSNIEGYSRKILVSQLRFYSIRLSYLSSLDTLSLLSQGLSRYPELSLQSKVMDSIYSRDVSALLPLGTNAVQSAAQILRLQDHDVTCSLASIGDVELQGLAILRLNGINVKLCGDVDEQTKIDTLNQFALNMNLAELMKDDDLFIKEIACLRGTEKLSKHQYFLDNAFDKDEHLTFDMIDQLHPSSYF